MESPPVDANSTLKEITGKSGVADAHASTSTSPEITIPGDRDAPIESTAEDLSKSNPPESAQAVSRSGATSRSGLRENEETRTPSTCSEGHQVREIDCDDLQDCDESLAEIGHDKQVLEATPQSSLGDDEGNENGVIPPSGLDEGTVGLTPVALLPRFSVTPGERGPRPSPALHSKSSQSAATNAAPPFQQQRGPLGALINWLDDADVDDVLDPSSLTDLIPSASVNHPKAGNIDHSMKQQWRSELAMSSSQNASDVEDDVEDVPSDKEGLPKAPPLASQASPHLRPPTPEPFSRFSVDAPNVGGYCAMPGSNLSEAGNEEEEWLARQRLTGAIGRLVRYTEADASPKDDILGLRSTSRGRIMVTAVRDRGVAMKAGVVAGDELVSIDGRKSFVGHPAHVVHASLKAPVVLVFLGFVGKLQAEVRVKRPPEPKCGLAPSMDVMQPVKSSPSGSLKLCDAVVFCQSQSGSLLITADNKEKKEKGDDGADGFHVTERNDAKTVMFELQREDARSLVFNSLGTMAML